MKINNIVRSGKATSKNPDRCWMNISFERVKIFENDDYFFSCIIGEVEYKYYGSVKELQSAFTRYDVDIMHDPDRYSFYLDYRAGKIYKTVSSNDQDVVITLQRVGETPLAASLSKRYDVSAQSDMRALFMDWLQECGRTPNTANAYASGVNTSSHFARNTLQWNVPDFYAITDSREMRDIYERLMDNRDYVAYDLQSNRSRSNGLRWYVDFLQNQQKVSSERWLQLMQSVDISTFLKYYLLFKHYPDHKCIQLITEGYTTDLKITKTAAAKAIFRENLNLEVLKYIIDDSSVTDDAKDVAYWYMLLETENSENLSSNSGEREGASNSVAEMPRPYKLPSSSAEQQMRIDKLSRLLDERFRSGSGTDNKRIINIVLSYAKGALGEEGMLELLQEMEQCGGNIPWAYDATGLEPNQLDEVLYDIINGVRQRRYYGDAIEVCGRTYYISSQWYSHAQYPNQKQTKKALLEMICERIPREDVGEFIDRLIQRAQRERQKG